MYALPLENLRNSFLRIPPILLYLKTFPFSGHYSHLMYIPVRDFVNLTLLIYSIDHFPETDCTYLCCRLAIPTVYCNAVVLYYYGVKMLD